MVNIAQCNIRSLNTSTKYVEDMCIKSNLSIICLSEIWHPNFKNLRFLHSWKWIKSERIEQQGGGVAIILHPSIKYIPRDDLKVPLLEAVWCEVVIDNVSILLCSAYIVPEDTVKMNLLIETLKKIENKFRNIIIVGDLNAKHHMWFNDNVITIY